MGNSLIFAADVLANITLAHCDAVGRGHPLHQLSVQINNPYISRVNMLVPEILVAAFC